MTTCRITVNAKTVALVLAFLAIGLASCKSTAIPQLKPSDLALSTPTPLLGPRHVFPMGAKRSPVSANASNQAPYRLDSGDRVRILVFGQQGLSNLYSVSSSGAVAVPLIGQVRARGLTTDELAQKVARKLGSKFVKDPRVTVEVVAYRPFYILGHGGRPGQYPYAVGLTVENAVAIAEGYKPRAKKRFVELTRKTSGVISTVKVPTDYPVKPGDTIYVLRRLF